MLPSLHEVSTLSFCPYIDSAIQYLFDTWPNPLPPAGARLLRLIPDSVRIILPDSGHAALLEGGVDLVALIRQASISQ